MGVTAKVLDRQAPRVLLATTAKWLSSARLVSVFAAMGAAVEVVCPPDHPMRRLACCQKTYNLSTTRPIASLERAITESRPDLIVSCDEPALDHLCKLHHSATPAIQRLIENSIGDLRAIDTALARSALIELAIAEGIPTPRSVSIRSQQQLEEQAARLGLPFVLKADTSAGGQGVRIVHRIDEAGILWERLRGPVTLPQTINRLLRDRDLNHVLHHFDAKTSVVMAQEFIEGREANLAAACWKGELLAANVFEVVHTWCVRGPSSVLRVVESRAMLEAARTLVRRVNYSGLCGFDFIFSPDGTPLLLEMNARPTQVAHLALGEGRDLVAAYLSAATGRPFKQRPAATDNPLIALFPQELQRDPESPMLAKAYHDVPNEPALVRFGLKARPVRGNRRAYQTLLDRFKRQSGEEQAKPGADPVP